MNSGYRRLLATFPACVLVACFFLISRDAGGVTILTMGDSTTYGYLLPNRKVDAYPAQLQAALSALFPKRSIQVVNRGVNAETSSGGLARIKHELSTYRPDFVIIQYGPNDSYHSSLTSGPIVPVAQYARNLSSMVEAVVAANAVPILASPVPLNATITTRPAPNHSETPYPDLGEGEYDSLQQPFVVAMAELAQQRGLAYVDVNLAFQQEIAAHWPNSLPAIYLDHIHPNKAGYRKEVAIMLPTLKALIAPTVPVPRAHALVDNATCGNSAAACGKVGKARESRPWCLRWNACR